MTSNNWEECNPHWLYKSWQFVLFLVRRSLQKDTKAKIDDNECHQSQRGSIGSQNDLLREDNWDFVTSIFADISCQTHWISNRRKSCVCVTAQFLLRNTATSVSHTLRSTYIHYTVVLRVKHTRRQAVNKVALKKCITKSCQQETRTFVNSLGRVRWMRSAVFPVIILKIFWHIQGI
jgi:hypothetical protein